MKKLSVLEISIIALLIGVTISAYLVYLINYQEFIGNVLKSVSLIPVLDLLDISSDKILLASFLFFVFVYTSYGVIIGFIIHKNNKTVFVFISIIIVLSVIIFLEQKKGTENNKVYENNDAIFINVRPNKNALPKEQYFGQEAVGDLNNDDKDDVAFLIPRFDENGTVYYISGSIKIDIGHTGTNLLFLGSSVLPKDIYIEQGTITVDYVDTIIKDPTLVKKIHFKVIEGKMTQIKEDSL